MRFLPSIVVLFLLLAAAANATSIDAKVLSELQDNSEVSVIIVLDKNVSLSISAPGFEKDRDIGIINGISGTISREGIGELVADPAVESIHPNRPASILLDGSAPVVNATLAWAVVQNSTNITGLGETVCVIDTGINYTHPSLSSKVIGGYDFVNSDNDSMDDNGHGTHVAGIIALSNDTYRGIAPNSSLVGIKALDSSGSGFENDIISGIDWCVANSTQYNISVISMSLSLVGVSYSGYCDSSETLFRDAINAAVSKNISVIAAAGNNGFTTNISSPACIRNATAVGSTTKSDVISSFSNRNNITDLLAPGSSITSAKSSCLAACTCSGNFMTCSGTSMATPMVAGAFALLHQYKHLENGTLLNPTEIENALKASGKNITDSSTGNIFQRINIFRALALLDASRPLLSIASPSNITYNTTNISLSYSASDNIALDVCTFTNTTDSTEMLSGCSNITFLAVANQQDNVTLAVNDTNGNANSSQVFFTIDTTYPLLSVSSPQNSTYNVTNTTLSYSASDTNSIDRCWFTNATGGSSFLNNPREACGNATFEARSGAQNNITVYVNDTGGNVNSTLVFFTVMPLMTVQEPRNASYSGSNLTVNYTASGDTCWLASMGQTTILPGCSNTTILAAANQQSNITLYVNDSTGNNNSVQVFFTVDTISPFVNFTSGHNETVSTTNDITINATSSEKLAGALLEWNGTNRTMNTSGSTAYHSFQDLPDGNYSFRVIANDSAGNVNVTAFRWLYINATRNFSSYISSMNSSLVNVTFSLLNTSGTGDASQVFVDVNYTLRFNASGIIAEIANFSWLAANTSNIVNVTRNITLGNLSTSFNSSGGLLDNYIWVDVNNFTDNYTPRVTFAGVFRLSYYINGTKESPDSRRINETCNENATNVPCYSISNTTTVYLSSFSGAAVGNDTQPPSISISSPSGTYSGSNISFSYSVSDNVGVDACKFSLNNAANVTPANCTNTTFIAASGSNTLTLYANDTSGNLNSSFVTFMYSPPAPASISGGGGGGGGGATTSAPAGSFRKSWDTITSYANATITTSSLPVKFIAISVNSTARSASITVSPEKTGPVPLDNAYQYFSINTTNLNKSLESAEITFAVNRSWLDFNEYDKTRTKLSRFDNGWIPLEALLIRENSTHLEYTATTLRFSYFVITGERSPPAQPKQPEINQTDGTVCIQVIQPAIKGGVCVNYPTPCDVPEGWTKVSECPAEQPQEEAPAPEVSTETAFLIVSGIAILLVIAAIYEYTRRKKRR